MLFDRDRQTLIWIIRNDHKNSAPKITAELNDNLKNPVSAKNYKGAAQCWRGLQSKKQY